jgi:dsDNA-specific endonuclease/ATPase MutS2
MSDKTDSQTEIRKANKADLQQEAERLGLATTGTKADLLARIEEAHDDGEDTAAEIARKMAEALRAARARYQRTTAYSGNRSMDNGDDLANLLSGSTPKEVVLAAEALLGLDPGELWDKYQRLNPGQQRMNAGNRIRAAWKRGDCTVEEVGKALSAADPS